MTFKTEATIDRSIKIELILIDGWSKDIINSAAKDITDSKSKSAINDIDFDSIKDDSYVIYSGSKLKTFCIVADHNNFGNQTRVSCADQLSEFVTFLFPEVHKRRRVLLEASEILYYAQMKVTEMLICKSK